LRKKLYLLVTVDTHKILGVYTDKGEAELGGANVASHCTIYTVSAHGD
jgi:hypothetical protein